MTGLDLTVLVLLAVAAGGGVVLGRALGYQIAIRAWQRHEIAHGRGWPPIPRPFPPPPEPPPAKSQTSLDLFRAAHPTGRVPRIPLD